MRNQGRLQVHRLSVRSNDGLASPGVVGQEKSLFAMTVGD